MSGTDTGIEIHIEEEAVNEALGMQSGKPDAVALALIVVAHEIRGLADVLAEALKEKT